MLTLTLKKLRFPNATVPNPLVVDLYISPFYPVNFTLIDSNVAVNTDGTINESPLPTTLIDPTQKYILRAVNLQCGFQYDQNVMVSPYCPPGYDLSPDSSYCFYEISTAATPPSGTPDTLVQKQFASYSTCGSYIYSPGYNVNGTGTSAQISLANAFWKNGGTCVDNTTTDGPLNRAGLWANTTMSDQDIGFGICLNFSVPTLIYVGIACDNYGIIKLNGTTIVQQDPVALAIQYPSAGALVCFRIWHIYPVMAPAGSSILEVLGHNVSSVAAVGMEIYNNTPAEIAAATSYSGLNLIFSSKDYFGQQVQIGTQNAGYTCAPGAALSSCSSPFECVQRFVTPVLY